MKRHRYILASAMFVATMMGVAPSAKSQVQTTGTPGSPSATTTIDGSYLPPPNPKFGGVINMNANDSKPYWQATVVPPKGAPNILLIMTDGQGYGVSSTFGGVIPTPALDRIAKSGLRYTQFHTTSLCSPTRAALLTGRNHHSVGFGVIAEMVAFDFKYDGPGFGKGGTGVLSVDGKAVSSKTIPYTIPFVVTIDESFDVGVDTRSGVDDNDYQPPFRFTGSVRKLTVKLVPPERTAEEEDLLRKQTQATMNARQ